MTEQQGGARVSDAVRAAQEGRLEDGVRFATLEHLQARSTPSLRAGASGRLVLGIIMAVLLFAPLGGLAAPVGGTDFGQMIASDGFQGQALRSVAMVCFTLGAIGQAWLLVRWVRSGRHRDGRWIASSVLAVACAGLALWWFPSLLDPSSYGLVVIPTAVTGLIGLLALGAQLLASDGTSRWEAQRAEAAERLRALPQAEQEALIAERREILGILRSRGLIDERRQREAEQVPLGDWWRLDRA